jgi:DNA transposition AAA+ family ATPase
MTNKTGTVSHIRPEQKAPEPFRPVKFEAAWVETENEQLFLALMDTIEAAAGYGRFGYLWDLAGRGKTDTTARFAAKRRLPFLRVRDDWKGSTLPFLQKLCLELGLVAPPHSRTRCIDKAIELLFLRTAKQRVIFIDEADRIPKHLDLMRDLADLSGAAFIFIGETTMPAIINENRRVWSRTLGSVRFEAVQPQSIVSYGRESAGLKIEPAAALLVNQARGGGDWRVIRNRVVKMAGLANAKKTREISEDLARLILDEEL